MAGGLVPIRRVVTANDQHGKSRVIFDGFAPNAHEISMGAGRGHTDLWIWNDSPARFSGDEDGGNLPYDFPCPPSGGHLRVVQARGRPDNYDAAKDPDFVPPHEPRERALPRTWDRGGNNHFSSAMHKTQTIDYAVLLDGERVLRLDDDSEIVLRQGDIVVQVGAWHQWTSSSQGGRMAFDMFAAAFVDGPAGTAQGNDPVMRPYARPLPAGVKPARRVVTIDKEAGKSVLVSDGPSPDVRTDPARPGYALARIWATDTAPAKIVCESLQLPLTIKPPAGGSVLNQITVPPDANWKGKVGAAEVRAFFAALGVPEASTYSERAPHPYMQKTRSLDFCMVTQGEVVLVLDVQEVTLKAGDVVIQQGTNHAWSNRTDKPAVVAIASHDAAA